MKRLFLLAFTHAGAVAVGFALGVYFLPILIAPPSLDAATLAESAAEARYRASLTRDLRGSDLLHWGDGTISVGTAQIVHEGNLAPGPDYKLYLTADFVDHEDAFEAARGASVLIGDVKTFDGFVLPMPADVNIDDFTSVLVWCETFGEFITAAQYRQP